MPSALALPANPVPAVPVDADAWDGLQWRTQEALILLLAPEKGNREAADTIRDAIGALRRELLGPAPTAIEHLLVDRIITTLLMVHQTERDQAIRLKVMGDSHLRPIADLVERTDRRVAAAHREHAAAIRNLVTIRRLGLPIVQVNIAEAGSAQMNIVAPARSEAAD